MPEHHNGRLDLWIVVRVVVCEQRDADAVDRLKAGCRVRDGLADDAGDDSGENANAADLAELKCLAVSEQAHGRGVGRRLVEACWEAAHELELATVFTLTYVPEFFEKCGYHRVEKSELKLTLKGKMKVNTEGTDKDTEVDVTRTETTTVTTSDENPVKKK